MAQAIRRSTENSGTIHPPPGHANYNMSAKAYYNIHGYVTIHIDIPLRQVYCNPPLRIPQYVFKYNYNYRCHALPEHKTPYEMAMGQKPDLSLLQEFGMTAWVWRLNTGKLESRCDEGQFVGFDEESKGYHVYFNKDEVLKPPVNTEV